METEAKANCRRCFLGENCCPLRLCSRRIDKGGPGQYYSNICFDYDSKVSLVLTLSGTSVVASWTFTLKEAGSNSLEIFKFSYHFVYFQTEGSWFESSK